MLSHFFLLNQCTKYVFYLLFGHMRRIWNSLTWLFDCLTESNSQNVKKSSGQTVKIPFWLHFDQSKCQIDCLTGQNDILTNIDFLTIQIDFLTIQIDFSTSQFDWLTSQYEILTQLTFWLVKMSYWLTNLTFDSFWLVKMSNWLFDWSKSVKMMVWLVKMSKSQAVKCHFDWSKWCLTLTKSNHFDRWLFDCLTFWLVKTSNWHFD